MAVQTPRGKAALAMAACPPRARRNFGRAQERAPVWLTGRWPQRELRGCPRPAGSADTGHGAHLRHDLLSLLIALHSQLAPERSRLFDRRIPAFGEAWLLLLLSNSGA